MYSVTVIFDRLFDAGMIQLIKYLISVMNEWPILIEYKY